MILPSQVPFTDFSCFFQRILIGHIHILLYHRIFFLLILFTCKIINAYKYHNLTYGTVVHRHVIIIKSIVNSQDVIPHTFTFL